MSKVSEQERRAAARAERRARAEQKPEPETAAGNGSLTDDGAEPVLDAGDALRTAASAAIAGAAVGAAKALARRRQEAAAEPHDDEPTAESASPEDERDMQPVDAAVDEPAVAEAQEPEREPDPEPQPQPEPDREPEVHRSAEPGEVGRMVQRAREQLRDLRGMDAETVASIKRTQDGWRIGLDVVEVKRIPESTDVLGTYELDLDDDGNLLTFERIARYHRSEADRR